MSDEPIEETVRLPIVENDREVSHLAVRITTPRGAGPAPLSILYLHGLGSSQAGEKADFFRRRAVAAGVTFWSFDFQGHGDSGGSMRDLTLSRNLDDVERVRRRMAAHGESPVALLGSSMGALSGLWNSARGDRPTAAGLFIAPALGLETAFVRMAGAEALARWEAEGVFPIQNELGSWEIGWDLVADLRRYTVEELASRLRTPTLLLQGKRDDRVDWRTVRAFAGRCDAAKVELHLFDDGDHRLVDRKDRLWKLMQRFLSRRGLLSHA